MLCVRLCFETSRKAILSTKFLNVKRKLLRGADERCEKLDRNAILPKIENLFTFIHKRKRHILDT